jgi:hypothetical protein
VTIPQRASLDTPPPPRLRLNPNLLFHNRLSPWRHLLLSITTHPHHSHPPSCPQIPHPLRETTLMTAISSPRLVGRWPAWSERRAPQAGEAVGRGLAGPGAGTGAGWRMERVCRPRDRRGGRGSRVRLGRSKCHEMRARIFRLGSLKMARCYLSSVAREGNVLSGFVQSIRA